MTTHSGGDGKSEFGAPAKQANACGVVADGDEHVGGACPSRGLVDVRAVGADGRDHDGATIDQRFAAHGGMATLAHDEDALPDGVHGPMLSAARGASRS